MKKSYTAIMKEIKDANHMVLFAGTEKVKQVLVDRREKLDDCLACPVLGRECPVGCKSL
jgi:hypothetical protein